MKKLFIDILIIGTLFTSGCAMCFVKVKPDGNWYAYGGAILKEIDIPSVAVTNSTTGIFVQGYKSTNETAKELIKSAVEKAL